MKNRSFFLNFGNSNFSGPKSAHSSVVRNLMLFSPGIMLVLLGVGFVLAPGLLLALLATFFIFLGVFVSLLIYRFLKFKKAVEASAREFQQNLRAQTFEVNREEDFEAKETKIDRIVLH